LVLITPTSSVSPTSPSAKINDTALYPPTDPSLHCTLPDSDEEDDDIRLCTNTGASSGLSFGCRFRSTSNISFPATCRDPTNRQVFTIDPHHRITVTSNHLTGQNVSLVTTDDSVYELSFGGNGGANGGAGGQGRGLNPRTSLLYRVVVLVVVLVV
jgi:hypothetical protein